MATARGSCSKDHAATPRAFAVSGTSCWLARRRDGVSRALQHLIRSKPSVILVASTTARRSRKRHRAGMARIGGHMERFWRRSSRHLLLLSYKDEIPIVSAPGLLSLGQSMCSI